MTEKITYDIALLNTSGAQRNPLEFLSKDSKNFEDSLTKVQKSFMLVENYNEVCRILGADTDTNLKLGGNLNVSIKDKTGELKSYNRNLLNTSLLYSFVKELNNEIGGESRIFAGIDNGKTEEYNPVLTKSEEFIKKYTELKEQPSEILKMLGANNNEYNNIFEKLKNNKAWKKIGKYNILALNQEDFENGIKRHIIFYFVYQLFLIEVFIKYLEKKTNTEGNPDTDNFKKLFGANFTDVTKKDKVLLSLFEKLGGNGVLMLNEVDKKLGSIKSLKANKELSVITTCYTGSGDLLHKDDQSVIISSRPLIPFYVMSEKPVKLDIDQEVQKQITTAVESKRNLESDPNKDIKTFMETVLEDPNFKLWLTQYSIKDERSKELEEIRFDYIEKHPKIKDEQELDLPLLTKDEHKFLSHAILNTLTLGSTPGMSSNKLNKDLYGLFQMDKNPIKEACFALDKETATVFICIHNNSNTPKQAVKDQIELINTAFSKPGIMYKYVLGIDTNSTELTQGDLEELKEHFHYYPTKINPGVMDDSSTTTNKHRTILQSQWSKAETDRSTKDLIITNIKEFTKNPRIERVTEGNILITETDDLIPDQYHLFDHFIVRGSIETKILIITNVPKPSGPGPMTMHRRRAAAAAAGGARKRKLKQKKRSLKLRGGYKKTRKRRRKNNKKRSRKKIVRKSTRKRN
jgi:hypothetical protein